MKNHPPCCASRRGFLAQACPAFIAGISGPGAPHWFEFQRREALGSVNAFIKDVIFGCSLFSCPVKNAVTPSIPQPSPFCAGNDVLIDNKFWSKAPEHPRDVVMRTIAMEICSWVPATYFLMYLSSLATIPPKLNIGNDPANPGGQNGLWVTVSTMGPSCTILFGLLKCCIYLGCQQA